MKNLTLKTVTRSSSDILININLSPFPDNVISSIKKSLQLLTLQKKVTASSEPNNDSTILFFSDEISLKNAYRLILSCILDEQSSDTFAYIQKEFSNMKSINISSTEKLENPILASLSILYSGKTFCQLYLPSYKSFMKDPIAHIVTKYLEVRGNIEIPFPAFNEDEVSISFIDFKDALSFGLFVACELL